jgi:sterol desaturase/sphingolipid hydroxylase (fatty acid hydroxylase superfamily)
MFTKSLLNGSSPEQLALEHVCVYWVFSFILLFCTGNRCKPPIKVVLVVLFNQCIIGYTMIRFMPVIPIDLLPQVTVSFALYSTHIMLYIMIYYVIHSVWFYWIHRLLHVRFFYKHIHYMHHMYRITIPYTAFYCHPLEHSIVNMMSVFIGPVIFPSSLLILKIWIHIGTLNTVYAHFSELRGDTPGFHDLHHLFYRFNYGTGSVMDRIFGTYMKPIHMISYTSY